MRAKTQKGHKYKLGNREFMVVEPIGFLRNSTLLKGIEMDENRALVVDRNAGTLTVHKYPLLEILYLTHRVGAKHRVNSYDFDSAAASLQVLYNRYGEGTVTVPSLGKAWVYDGGGRVLAELGFVFTEAIIRES